MRNREVEVRPRKEARGRRGVERESGGGWSWQTRERIARLTEVVKCFTPKGCGTQIVPSG